MKTPSSRYLLVCLVLLVAPPLIAQERFRFTAIPDENTARLKERFDKVAVYLSEKTGVAMEYVPVKSYAAAVAAFKNNDVQLAWFGGLAGVKARRSVPGSVAIAQGEEDQQFVTYFIANAATGLSASESFPAAIAGHTFTFGSKGSTSGRLMPEYYIRKHFDKAPDQVFKRVGFSGDHSKTLALVQSGSYELGALNYKVWENEVKAGSVDTTRVKVIWRTPPYPDYNWSIRGDVEDRYGIGFTDTVRQALIGMRERELLDSFPRTSFIAADNSMYGPILEIGTAIGVFDK